MLSEFLTYVWATWAISVGMCSVIRGICFPGMSVDYLGDVGFHVSFGNSGVTDRTHNERRVAVVSAEKERHGVTNWVQTFHQPRAS